MMTRGQGLVIRESQAAFGKSVSNLLKIMSQAVLAERKAGRTGAEVRLVEPSD